jgi:hypothetical protein
MLNTRFSPILTVHLPESLQLIFFLHHTNYNAETAQEFAALRLK